MTLNMPLNHPAVDQYYGVPGHYIAWGLVTAGLVLFLSILWKRWAVLRMGRTEPQFSQIKRRLLDLFLDGILQKRQLRYPSAGVLHIIIYWGFIILALHSVEMVASGLWPGFSFSFLNGVFGVFYNTIKDLFVLLVFVACILSVYRRVVVKPARYQDSRQLEAYLVLFLIVFLMITDMAYETVLLLNGPVVTPGFSAVAYLAGYMFSGMNPHALKLIHHLSYWLHLVCFLFFLNLLPMSKHFHILTALPNVFFKKQDKGVIKPPRWDQYDLRKLDSAGVNTFSDFTWKHILDFFTCTECGRCTDNCPAYATGNPLSPKSVTMTLRDFAYHNASLSNRHTRQEKSIPGNIIADETFWACTTCGACEEECPAFITYIDKLVELRRHRVLMESRLPFEIEQIYRNMEIYGDAWAMGPALKTDWARGLNVTIVRPGLPVDILFWVGCAGAFDSRARQIAVSFVRILQKAGVSFGILGAEENCCGDYARRTGNEYLFQSLARKNIETLNRYGIKKIVILCPHGYHAIKNEYPQMGGNFEVIHASEFLMKLIKEKKLSFHNKNNAVIAYHDPCYLGRHNGIYEAPRKILSQLPGAVPVEPDKTRDRSFCCGAGGGHFWMESSSNRINDMRIDQILEKKPDIIATACPYCVIMLEDGLESKELKGLVLVKDIMELAAENIIDF